MCTLGLRDGVPDVNVKCLGGARASMLPMAAAAEVVSNAKSRRSAIASRAIERPAARRRVGVGLRQPGFAFRSARRSSG